MGGADRTFPMSPFLEQDSRSSLSDISAYPQNQSTMSWHSTLTQMLASDIVTRACLFPRAA